MTRTTAIPDMRQRLWTPRRASALGPFAVLVCAFLLLVALPAAAGTDPRIDAIERALQLPETFAVLEEEGAHYGEELAKEILPGGANAAWRQEVVAIYAPARIEPLFRAQLATSLAGSDLDAILAFVESDLGRRLVTLELSARRALLDPSVEDASLLRLEELHETRDPRLGRIETLLTAGDLVEENVASAMNANLAFYNGLADGGSQLGATGNEDILGDVWAQEDDVRAETTEWLMQMLVLAYAPLDDAEIDAYGAFMATMAGKQLNRALFDAYGAVFNDVSYQLGRAAARVLSGQDI